MALMELQRQVAYKDDQLTETRLEALSSAAQVDNLRETVAKLRTELRRVRKDNEELRANMATFKMSADKGHKGLFFPH